MSQTDSRFHHWINSEFKSIDKSLPIFRVVYALFVLLVYLPQYLWISNYPDTFFLPRISIAFFWSGFPDLTFFYILNFLLIVAVLALLVGYRTFYTSIAVGLLLFIGNSWAYSFGKINHDIVIVLLPLLLSVSYWGANTSNSTTSSSSYRSWPIPIFALLLGLAMLTAAIAKVSTGWLDPSTSALAGHLVRNYFVAERETVLAFTLLSQNSLFLFKLLDYGTLILESAFIVAIFSKRYFRLACAFACLFHLGIQLTMEISFTTNIIAYALFVNWSYLRNFATVKNGLQKFDSISKHIGLLSLVIVSIPIWALYVFIGNPFYANINIGLSYLLGGNLINTVILTVAATISLWYIYQLLSDPLSRSKIFSGQHQAIES